MNERRFPAEVPAVAGAVAWARAEADAAGLPEARGLDLELAVEEVVMNVCLHAYGGRGGTVTLRTGASADGFLVDVEDEGPEFDPLSAPAPDTSAPLEARPIGGLGIFLVRRVADAVTWRRAGGRNVLTLVFAPRPEQAPEPGREAGCSSP